MSTYPSCRVLTLRGSPVNLSKYTLSRRNRKKAPVLYSGRFHGTSHTTSFTNRGLRKLSTPTRNLRKGFHTRGKCQSIAFLIFFFSFCVKQSTISTTNATRSRYLIARMLNQHSKHSLGWSLDVAARKASSFRPHALSWLASGSPGPSNGGHGVGLRAVNKIKKAFVS